jgi:hypothetical protein
MAESPDVPSTARAEIRSESAPEWSTFAGQRRRLLLFLIFAAAYIGYHLVVSAEWEGDPPSWIPESLTPLVSWLLSWLPPSRGWVFEPFFNGDWYYFGGVPPPWYDIEYLYRWFLTMLPLAAWVAILFFLLTRVRFLAHRHVAFVIIFLGLVFFEGDMRWYNMSKKHATLTDILVVLDVDASSDLGLRDSDYEEIRKHLTDHLLYLSILALLAGPELRLCLRAIGNSAVGAILLTIWNGTVGACILAIWNGPLGRTWFARAGWWMWHALVWFRPRFLDWLDSKAAFACVAALVMVDPVVIWALEKGREDTQGERTVTRYIADANPLRWQSLDRTWGRMVLGFTEEGRDLAAANAAMRDLDSFAPAVKDPILALPKPKPAAKPYNILILQAETLNAKVFDETDLPYISEFKKKCLRLNNHFSVANATHYGIMGLLHGNPVTFFTGPRPADRHRPNEYLDHFKDHGYKTRLITRSVMSHHKLGHYLPNWTEPVSEPPGDWKVIPKIHEELAQPGPRLVYSFYHATHYPYDHTDEPPYQKYQPEVDYEFKYKRPNLPEWREQIVNRYKNTLLELDTWYKDILDRVDLDNTIVFITGDHGEEFFEQGRLGHCSSLNIHQTMTPGFLYIPGVQPADVTFVTSNADILPTIADALGHQKKPESLGQSLFEPVSFRYAVLSHFDYTRCLIWAIATDDRMTHFERDYWDNVQIMSLTNWKGERLPYRSDAASWEDHFRIIRRVEEKLRVSRE